MAKEKLQFYDLKAKKKFKTDKYTYKIKNKRRFAVTKDSPSKGECWRILGMAK